MGAMQKLKNLFVGEDELEQEDAMYQQPVYENKTEYNEAPKNTVAYGNNARPVRMEQTTTLQIVLARPNDFSEVKSIGGDINEGKTVLLNLETVKSEDAKRILDFISGVAYANGADIKMMAQKTFAIMPRNVGFSGVDLMSELENNGYSF